MFPEQMKRDEQHGTYPISGEIDPANVETAKVRKVDKRTFEQFEKISNVEVINVQKNGQNGNLSSKKVVTSECIKMDTNISVEKVEEKQASGIVPNKLSSMIKCSDCIREIVREKLYFALSKVSSEGDEEIREKVDACNPVRVAILLESAMFEKWGRSNGTYKMKYKAVIGNLKDPKNPDFRRKVLLRQLKPETVVNLTAAEMASDRRQCWYQQREKERARIKERDRILYGNDSRKKDTINRLKCGRCGHKEISYKEWSWNGDQSLIQHLTCLNCNQYWSATTLLSGVLPI